MTLDEYRIQLVEDIKKVRDDAAARGQMWAAIATAVIALVAAIFAIVTLMQLVKQVTIAVTA